MHRTGEQNGADIQQTGKWTHRFAQTLILAGLPAVVLTFGALFADKPLGILLVLGEPLLLAGGLYLVVLSVWNRNFFMATAFGFAVAIGGYAIHEPTTRYTALGGSPEWVRELRGCTILPKPVTGPVRILTWSIDPQKPIDTDIDTLLTYSPDIVVIYGTDSPKLGDKISAALDGEAKFFRGNQDVGGIMAIVRGSFQYCGGSEDTWEINLPALQGGSSQVLLGFPHITDIGVVPLMMVRLDAMEGPADLLPWADRVAVGASQTGAIAQSLGTRRLILVGNLQVPAQAQAVALPLVSSGLSDVRTNPNWPHHYMGIPFLPQHALDHIWIGRDWHAQATRILDAAGQQRAPIMVDLVPETRTQR
ncbi:MAG: hypothetical protein CL930_04845 [Deltaproteobacteria bacterium]|nr:hypothetical protein [Deltaproteobacteria bacterium]